MKLEMRTVQKIAAAAMTLAVMFGCASPLKPLAASAAQNTVSVSADIDEENSYISAQDQMYQKDFLKLINKARAKAGLNSVELGDSAHNAAAAERAGRQHRRAVVRRAAERLRETDRFAEGKRLFRCDPSE